MEPLGTHDHNEARNQLLKEGARSYRDAVTAIVTYQQEVQKICREALLRHLDDYSAALKVRLVSTEIQDIAWSDLAKWKGDVWSLGVEIARKDISKLRWWELNCFLQYESSDQKLYCWIGEWFPNRKMAAHVLEEFRRRKPAMRVNYEDREIWLEHKLTTENDAAVFGNDLEELITQWIELWKAVGGINEVFKRYKE